MLEFVLPFLFGYIFSILIFFRLRTKVDKGSYTVSLSTFIIALAGFAFGIMCIVGANDSIAFYLAGFSLSGGSLFGFISLAFKSNLSYFRFQKIRNITLLVLSILYILALSYMLIGSLVKDLRSGMILGVSNEIALAAAEKELNPNVHYGPCQVTDKYDYYEDGRPAPITIYCDVFFGSTDKVFMSKEVLISARSGNVMYLDNEYKVKLTLTKNGSPMADTHVFSGMMESDDGRFGDTTDYGVTDQDGKVVLLVYPEYINRVYTLDYKYIDLPANVKSDYSINWDEAKQLPEGGLLFQKDPYGKAWSSPYDDNNTNQNTNQLNNITYSETGPITTFYYDPANLTGTKDLNTNVNKQLNVICFKVPGYENPQTVIIDPTSVFEKNGNMLTKDQAKGLIVIGANVTVTYTPVDDQNHYSAIKIVFN